jgi:hypothetical protein
MYCEQAQSSAGSATKVQPPEGCCVAGPGGARGVSLVRWIPAQQFPCQRWTPALENGRVSPGIAPVGWRPRQHQPV